jgi:hypothetical protein
MSAACHFSIFEVGCTDTSTKESRILKEQEELCKIQKKNPNKVVLNRRGKATALKNTAKCSVPAVQHLPRGYLMEQLQDLRQRCLLHNKSCTHNAKRVSEANRMVCGNSSYGGPQIAIEYDICAETVVAAYSGYYRVDGEMVFLHSDGSICRIPADAEAFTCACGIVHA